MTGGAGFIGSHIVESLVRDGYRVRVLDNLFAGKRKNVPEGVEFVQGDITARDDVRFAMQGIDRVMHLAALRSVPASMTAMGDYFLVNVGGTAMICDEALKAGVKRVVSVSSSSVYGNAQLPLKEGRESEEKSPYASSKRSAERVCVLAAAMGLDVVSLRYFNVFGPRQDPTGGYATFIPGTILKLSTGQRQTIHEDGEQTRDFNPVANTVHGSRLALFSPKRFQGEAFNVASGKPHTVNDVYERTRSSVARYVPAAAQVEPTRTGVVREGDIRHTAADLSLVERELGYHPVQTFEDGLDETVDYFLQRSI